MGPSIHSVYDAVSGAKIPKSVHTNTYQTFLRHLRSERELRGVSQRELGRRLEKPHTYIGKCESGERQLNIAELKMWCDALDVSLSRFILNLEDEWQQDK